MLLLKARIARYYLKDLSWRRVEEISTQRCQELYNYQEKQLLNELKTQVGPSERAPLVLLSGVEVQCGAKSKK